ncbi:hypothetical protein [Azospirillum sp. B4]|uniref:hypothetical protein n=1 Tax=Azospirillum sp. B4 TaxID=95605 RepID=UPI0003479CBE|nr:hypothetical protein [Azospirillum sp. B4]
MSMATGAAAAQDQPASPPRPTILAPATPLKPQPSVPPKPADAPTSEFIIEAPRFILPDPLEQETFLREEAEKWRFNNMETYYNPNKEDKYLRLPEMNTGSTLDQRYLGSQLHPCKLNKEHVLTCR